MDNSKEVIAYKGFDGNFKCNGFQYKVGESYEHKGKIVMCSSGFHACKNPLDVLGYYGPFENKFAKVQLSGEVITSSELNNSKMVASKITVISELTLSDFINNCVNWIINDIP